MKEHPSVALQFWSLRDLVRVDLAGAAAAAGAIGYSAVELAGYGNLDAAGAQAALAAAGLRVVSLHVGPARLRQELPAVLHDALLFGARHVVCSSWPREQFTTAAAAQCIGEQLGAIGQQLRPWGIQLSFHNHAHELRRVEGRTFLDWMLDAAEPRNLCVQPDVYWLHQGGQPPAEFLRRHGARCRLIHLKDERELGLGPVDFPSVFEAADGIGAAECYIVEQEQYTSSPLEGVRACLEQMRRWGRT